MIDLDALNREQFSQWFAFGELRGWVAGFCGTHDMPPMTAGEELAMELGEEPCLPCLRVWGPSGPPDSGADVAPLQPVAPGATTERNPHDRA